MRNQGGPENHKGGHGARSLESGVTTGDFKSEKATKRHHSNRKHVVGDAKEEVGQKKQRGRKSECGQGKDVPF